MKKIIALFILISILCTGCEAASTPAPSPDAPTSNDSPPPAQVGDYAPNPADNDLQRGEAFVLNIQMLTMESYPLQFSLTLKGNLPTPCHQLRVAVSPPNEEQKIIVDVYSVFDPNELCAEVIQEFEVNIPLGSFPGGHYTIWVNGQQAAEIDG
jgi:hypothetical protein